MKKWMVLLPLAAMCAQGAIIGVSGPNSTTSITACSPSAKAPAIIAAPSQVLNGSVTNCAQQGFNEQQDVALLANISVDSGVIALGTIVDSHMIFLNGPGGAITHDGVIWEFSGDILGVMSDVDGNLEAGSTNLLGAIGTSYPGVSFNNRGLEARDGYSINGRFLTVNMAVTQPGDWIRVVTANPVPEPGTYALMGAGLAALGFLRRRKA